jgi:molybdopterin-containing oxidoreductase family iron-sulfur binding subunit
MVISRRGLLKGFGGAVGLLFTGIVASYLPRSIARGASNTGADEAIPAAATSNHGSAMDVAKPGAASGASASAGNATGKQWGMVIDLTRCDGCKECTGACQVAHYLTNDQEWIKVYEVEAENGGTVFMPRPCMHCQEAPCLKVCPVRATFKNDEGVILIDQDLCIGCRICMAACPYNARYFNWWEPPQPPEPHADPHPEFPVPQQRGTVGKCEFCTHRTAEGRLPPCVEACRMDAIYIAELNTGVMTNRSGETYQMQQYLKEHDAYRYKEELNTSPRVWYVSGHGQSLDESQT